eukprot:m.74937 g.74937  ORF g.74937 m.74937 type:complete len:243 (+) comp8464_c0_seq1:90-818(+)
MSGNEIEDWVGFMESLPTFAFTVTESDHEKCRKLSPYVSMPEKMKMDVVLSDKDFEDMEKILNPSKVFTPEQRAEMMPGKKKVAHSISVLPSSRTSSSPRSVIMGNRSHSTSAANDIKGRMVEQRKQRPVVSTAKEAVVWTNDFLKGCSFFYPSFDRFKAESRLKGKKQNTFLLRNGSGHDGFCISVVGQQGTVLHFRLILNADYTCHMIGQETLFPSVISLLQYHKKNYIDQKMTLCEFEC